MIQNFKHLRAWFFPLGMNLSENLLRASLVISLRWVILTVEFAIAVIYGFMGKLQWESYSFIVLSVIALIVFNTIVTIYAKGKATVSTSFLTSQLFFDLFQLFIFLKLVVSKTNPLVEIFYLPLIVALIVLPFLWNFLYTIVVAILIGTFYLSHKADHHNYHHFYSHLFTMALICLTLNLLMSFIRHFQERLQNVQNYKQRMDHLKVVGAMTSGFCHQMATPLNTIKLRLDRMNRIGEFSKDDINSALMALGQCEGALRELAQLRVDKNSGLNEQIELRSFCEGLIANSYPEIKFCMEEKNKYIFSHPQLLTQTLLDLFDNAMDATMSGVVSLSITQDHTHTYFEVVNHNAIISEEVLEKVGEPFNSTKESGAGLGLFNALNTALMMNGSFKIFNQNKNVHALLSLPLKEGDE
jgi:two-component system sensor histidine kinase RegB